MKIMGSSDMSSTTALDQKNSTIGNDSGGMGGGRVI